MWHVPPQAGVTKRRGLNGKLIEGTEPLAGVFGPVPAKGLLLPAYTWGPKPAAGGKPRTTHLFQCPVSAIPAVVWDLLDLWFQCRLLRVLPDRLTDLGRRAFVAFEIEMQGVEAQRGNGSAERAALLALTKVMHR